MIEKAIRIRVLSYAKTDLLMAVSDDLRGLVVHARSAKELEAKIPAVVRDLLEADGFTVANLNVVRDIEVVGDFVPDAFIANASLSGSRDGRRVLATD